MATSSEVSDRRGEFLTRLKDWKVKARVGGEYVKVEELDRWMCDRAYSNIYELLYQCHSQRDSFSLDRDTVKSILEGPRRCVLVFSILLELNEGRLIHHLKKKGFYDWKLPMGLDQVEQAFKSAQDGYRIEEPEILAKCFHDLQWKYCPLRFDMGEEDHDVLARQVIPICAMDHIQEGGTAHLYQVAIPQEFVSRKLQKALPNSLYEDIEHGPCYVFALKMFKDGNDTMYNNEYRAFRALKDNSGMIKCLCGFSQQKHKYNNSTDGEIVDVEDANSLNYYLLLEYGEHDLWDYFASHLPPVLEPEQLKFWSDLFLVVDAIKDIHSFKFSTIKEVKDYYGWHADIKPDNILNVGGEFKMADPGFARFEERPKDGTTRVWTKYFGGATAFGAPECYKAQSRPDPMNSVHVGREIDVWSLGCVFSVAATWMVYGLAGLEQFDTMRRQSIQKIVKSRSLPPTLDAGNPEERGLGLGGYFHDGENVLQAVREWHNFLRRGMRNNDVMTKQVLQIVEEDMLVSNPEKRQPAEILCQKLGEVISKTTVGAPVHCSVQDALYKTEEDWKKKTEKEARDAELGKLATIPRRSEFRFSQPSTNLGRTTSRLLTGTLQTSHRSKAAPDGSGTRMSPPRILLTSSSGQTRSAIALQTKPDTKQHTPAKQSPLRMQNPSHEANKSVSAATNQNVATPSVTRTPTSASRSSLSPRMIEKGRLGFKAVKERLKKSRPDQKLKRLYHDRDLIFLIDNGASMIEFWDEMKRVLESLVSQAKGVNKYGMGLRYCNGQTMFSPSNDPKVFSREMDKQDHVPVAGQNTNMGIVLTKIFKEYLDKVDNANKTQGVVRNKTLIVLTDGIWGAMSDNKAVEKAIIHFNKLLRNKIKNFLGGEERRLSIQFVQFGDDRGATRRLRRLDTKLKHEGAPDIVDHKTNDTAPVKILISAVDESDDESDLGDEDGEDSVDDSRQSPSPMGSPTSMSQQRLVL